MKLGFFEGGSIVPKELINSEQGRFDIIQAAQMELIERAGGESIAVDWITANSKPYRKLMDDAQNNYIESLAHEETREEALREIQKKLSN